MCLHNIRFELVKYIFCPYPHGVCCCPFKGGVLVVRSSLVVAPTICLHVGWYNGVVLCSVYYVLSSLALTLPRKKDLVTLLFVYRTCFHMYICFLVPLSVAAIGLSVI